MTFIDITFFLEQISAEPMYMYIRSFLLGQNRATRRSRSASSRTTKSSTSTMSRYIHFLNWRHKYLYVCVCVCERERERERVLYVSQIECFVPVLSFEASFDEGQSDGILCFRSFFPIFNTLTLQKAILFKYLVHYWKSSLNDIRCSVGEVFDPVYSILTF